MGVGDRVSAMRLRPVTSLLYEPFYVFASYEGLSDPRSECQRVAVRDNDRRALSKHPQSAYRCRDHGKTERPRLRQHNWGNVELGRDNKRGCPRHPNSKLIGREPALVR